MDLALQIVAGVGLAACAGLRAFVPLLIVALAARVDLIRPSAGFEWIASTSALLVLGTAVVVEVIGDKIPWVDHALDSIGIVARPVAGALVMLTTLSDASPVAAAILALLLGVPAAAGTQVLKAGTRLLSTAGTGGVANPVASLFEDVLALAGSVLSLVVPAVVLLAIVLLAILLLRRRRGREAAA